MDIKHTEAVDMRENVHLEFLDGLRATCALFVAVYHAYLANYITDVPSALVKIISYPFLYGHFAVAIFIVISGFSLMLPVVRGTGKLKGGATSFFRNRAKRILPPYYLAMIVFVVGYLFIERQTINPFDIVAHFFLVHNLFPDMIRSKLINPSFWSIAVEFQIYLIFPLLVSLWWKYGGFKITLLVSIIAYIFFALLYNTPLQGITPHFYALFALGMLGSTIAYSPLERWVSVRDRFPARALMLTFLILIIGLCQIWGPGTDVGYQKGILEGLVGLFAMSILIYMSRSKQTIIRNAFSWKPLAFIGTFSYSLYLLHQPLLNVVLRGGKIFHLDNDGRFLFALVIGVPLIVCVAYAFFCVGEKPFMRKPSRVVPSFGVSNKDETISVAHQ